VLAQAQQNECQSGQGLLLLADILQNDPNLTIGATWVENSGANLALANPFTNVTLFGTTDSVGLEYYEKYCKSKRSYCFWVPDEGMQSK
jgi:hypothetical protein